MKYSVLRRLKAPASQLRDYMLIEFEDGEPRMVRDVRHLAKKVLFIAAGVNHSLDADDSISIVLKMKIAD